MTLLEAVQAGDHPAVLKLLQSGEFADSGGSGGQTPLMVAAARGDLPMVQLLLNGGADPRLKDDAGDTALLKAAAQGHGGVFALLAPHADADELDMARAFLRNAGIDPAAVPVSTPRDEPPSKLERGVATFAARASKFFGDEVPEQRLERVERSEGRDPKKR